MAESSSYTRIEQTDRYHLTVAPTKLQADYSERAPGGRWLHVSRETWTPTVGGKVYLTFRPDWVAAARTSGRIQVTSQWHRHDHGRPTRPAHFIGQYPRHGQHGSAIQPNQLSGEGRPLNTRMRRSSSRAWNKPAYRHHLVEASILPRAAFSTGTGRRR